MKNRWLYYVAVGLLIALGISVTVFANREQSKTSLAGELYQTLYEETDPRVLATYHGQDIMSDVVAYTVQMNLLYNPSEFEGLSDTEQQQKAIDHILKSIILLEEAERLELEATPKEIEAQIKNVLAAYENPEGKTMINDYCASLDITFEEYLAILYEQFPRMIARQKLEDEIGKQYCEEHGLAFTRVNAPEEMTNAINQYIDELMQEKKEEVLYYDQGAVTK